MWWKKTRPNMKMAADLKAMNRGRVIETDIPIIERKLVEDHVTGEPKIVEVHSGTRRGPKAIQRVKPRDLHALAMGSPR